jgi:hypothetical protein
MELILENVSALATKLGTEPEIITKFLTDAAATEEVKPFAEKLGKLQVFPEDIFNTRLENERQQAAEKAKNLTLGTTYGAVDERVKKATGIEKQTGESTLDYQERAFREKFSKTTDTEETQRLRDDLAASKNLLAAKSTEFETYKSGVEKQTAKQRLDSNLTAPLAAIAETLVEPGQQEYIKFMFEQKYTGQLNGETVEYKDKATGEIVRDTNTAAPMTGEALLKQFAPTVKGVSFKKPSPTSGSGFQGSSTNLNSGSTETMDFSGFASTADFNAELRKQGIAAGSDRAGKLYEAFKKARTDLFAK